MALTPFSSALLQRFSDSGTDGGGTDNTKRTPGLFIGGHEFTITLMDYAGFQTVLKLQVNNSNPIDPTKKEHYISPKDLAIASRTSMLIDSGAWGGNNDQTKESSASAADFNSNSEIFYSGRRASKSHASLILMIPTIILLILFLIL